MLPFVTARSIGANIAAALGRSTKFKDQAALARAMNVHQSRLNELIKDRYQNPRIDSSMDDLVDGVYGFRKPGVNEPETELRVLREKVEAFEDERRHYEAVIGAIDTTIRRALESAFELMRRHVGARKKVTSVRQFEQETVELLAQRLGRPDRKAAGGRSAEDLAPPAGRVLGHPGRARRSRE